MNYAAGFREQREIGLRIFDVQAPTWCEFCVFFQSSNGAAEPWSVARPPYLPSPAGSLMRKQPAQIVTNKRSPVVHVSTEVPRPLGEAFEDIARANGITKAELLRRLIQALVEKMKTGR
jgi:hypothetical protein